MEETSVDGEEATAGGLLRQTVSLPYMVTNNQQQQSDTTQRNVSSQLAAYRLALPRTLRAATPKSEAPRQMLNRSMNMATLIKGVQPGVL